MGEAEGGSKNRMELDLLVLVLVFDDTDDVLVPDPDPDPDPEVECEFEFEVQSRETIRLPTEYIIWSASFVKIASRIFPLIPKAWEGTISRDGDGDGGDGVDKKGGGSFVFSCDGIVMEIQLFTLFLLNQHVITIIENKAWSMKQAINE